MDDFAELGLGKVGNTDSGSFLSINSFHPFMGFGKLDGWIRKKSTWEEWEDSVGEKSLVAGVEFGDGVHLWINCNYYVQKYMF